MLQFDRSAHRWWQKPLVHVDGRDLPAELVVLEAQLGAGESGAWLNSRGVTSGVVNVVRDSAGKFKSVRARLPDPVTARLRALYSATGLRKGAPDLVIWDGGALAIRFVEVKNPHWDHVSPEQLSFHRVAAAQSCPVVIVEWEFRATQKDADRSVAQQRVSRDTGDNGC
jgi:hypothetical protein